MIKGFIVFLAAAYAISGNIYSPCAIAQTIKATDSMDPAYFSLKDDMKSYQIIYKEHAKDYLDYYNTIREKVVQKLKYNYRDHYSNGDVDLFFILNSNGSLGRIDVDLGKSTTDNRLIDIAILSIQQASPFPHFPKELDASELPFSLAISFKESKE